MPEYLAPGVYVEETSFRSKSIEGVSTSTTGFAGPTRKGPVGEVPELLTSFADFQRIYGGLNDVTFGGSASTNYIAHAVRAFFNEGGARLYVARAFTPNSNTDPGTASVALSGTLTTSFFKARFPGASGNGTIKTTAVTTAPATGVGMASAAVGSMVVATGTSFHYVKQGDGTWSAIDGGAALNPNPPTPTSTAKVGNFVTLTVDATDADGNESIYTGLAFDKAHPNYVGSVLGMVAKSRADHLARMFAIAVDSAVTTSQLHDALVGANDGTTGSFTLANGNDGAEPNEGAYDTDTDASKGALTLLSGVEDISIVATPGSSAFPNNAQAVRGALISHAEKRRSYRIAVLDTAAGDTIGQARDERSQIDSTRAALYYPWVVVANPNFTASNGLPPELTLPPSGFLCGIYARSDINRAVFKAPANEVVQSALRFERDVHFAEQEVLNPLGVNCLRFFPGRGYRVWGARTVSSDPEWKYVNIRRYFNYLERSIDIGTQWAVFEPNGERLWANIRDTITSFLVNEWRSGALLGTDITQAFFVKCDRTTMDQNDLDNGRLICLVGVAAVKPAEFVIFRVGQKTADSRT